jgi:hypothetical protein
MPSSTGSSRCSTPVEPVSGLHDPAWQMSSGEQAAIEGLLRRLEPGLAVEIGTAEGTAARHLAEQVGELHCFDLSPPSLELPSNVTMHVGDSHEQLPQALAEFAEKGRNVDFAVVDGDHSASGVRQDVEDLLDSPAVGRTVIVIHDTANERVRHGLDAVRFAAWPKVAHVHLDWIPGQLFREPGLENELWYGLGLVVADAARTSYRDGEVVEGRYFPAGPLLIEGREAMLHGAAGVDGPRRAGEPSELEDLRWEVDRMQDQLDAQADLMTRVLGSSSWRWTEPLRRARVRLNQMRRNSDS